jgi:F0F1-type ATP synthase assembly protein I
MADDDQKPATGDGDDNMHIHVPSHDPLPLPPDVHYARPQIGQHNLSRQRPSGEQGAGSEPSQPVRYTMGLAGGFSLIGSLFAGYWLGSLIDAHWIHAQTPWGTIVMVLAGTFVGFYNMFRMLNRIDGKKK